VLSTPISIVSALAAAARRGVLIKGGIFLEKLATLRVLALDKTGTLTHGTLSVHEIAPATGHTATDVVATAAALSRRSEHPLARAIRAYAAVHDITPPRTLALRALPGEGMSGLLARDACCGDASGRAYAADAIAPSRTQALRASMGLGEADAAGANSVRFAADAVAPPRIQALRETTEEGLADDVGSDPAVAGVEVLVGSRRLFEQRGIAIGGLVDSVQDIAKRGMTVVMVAEGQRAIGVIGLVDEVRLHGREAVELLRAEGIRHVALLTGDHRGSAEAAAAVGRVDSVEAGLLPADKVAAIERLRRAHGAIAMVGDGINDAPALAAADVGIAMGVAGTDAAIETADVALMADDLRAVSYVIRLGRKTLRTVQVNVAIALGLKLAFLSLALAGVATLWMAVVADMGASLIVVGNALRLLRAR
jgi:Cd2+/Zn2+-exporting ATPase